MKICKAKRCLAVLLASLFLTGCTAQSTPLGERAVVRLIFLEKADPGYSALAVVCDFSGGEQAQQAAVVQKAQGDTIEQALWQAAAQRGGEPFFAQNRLLLLGPRLAAEELPAVLDYFAANCGAYRDPALWLWYGGQNELSALPEPMAFVQMAEKLTQEDVQGCVLHVLECGDEQTVVLPVLEQTEQQEKTAGVKAGGLAVPDGRALQLYRAEEVLLGYGLLRGLQKEQLLPVEYAGEQYTLRLEELQRDLFVQNGRLCLMVPGACSTAAESSMLPKGLQTAAEQAVRQQCAAAWHSLTQKGVRDIFALRWWGQQLGASVGSEKVPLITVSFHLD